MDMSSSGRYRLFHQVGRGCFVSEIDIIWIASFIRSHIICRYGVPHELISDRGVHFRADVDIYYRDTVFSIIDRLRLSDFFSHFYKSHIYSLVYGMEAVLLVEIEMGSLRVALDQQIPEVDWAQFQLDHLNLLNERRLRAAYHVVLIREKWPVLLRSGSSLNRYKELTLKSAAWLMDLDGNRFSEPTNVDQLKRAYSISVEIRRFHGVACSSSLTRITHLMMDDLMSPDFLIYYTFDAILGHISLRLRFVDFHRVACSSPLTRITHLMMDDLIFSRSCMLIPAYEDHAFDEIDDLMSPDFLIYHTF
ncbi:hypothetical protein CK203_096072 [Vitis vinifera]|uniref:Integrase catalytic domain-containing protein n=1 Tax=Vitis vinifera TaxID=29760 RepID=A0A438CGR6_VITVI|nr:hypothetical protein CK203_096072 [Vitis vinifera]